MRGRAIDRRWDDAPDGAGVAFFDAVVPAVEGAFCTDASRRFATGYSSGAFMAHRHGTGDSEACSLQILVSDAVLPDD